MFFVEPDQIKDINSLFIVRPHKILYNYFIFKTLCLCALVVCEIFGLVERNLTKTEQLTRMLSAGETEATSAEEHLARDNQPKATNCRWGGQLYTCHPLLTAPKTIQSFLMPKKTSLPKARLSLNGKVDLSNSR
jgi:hypothetical protein